MKKHRLGLPVPKFCREGRSVNNSPLPLLNISWPVPPNLFTSGTTPSSAIYPSAELNGSWLLGAFFEGSSFSHLFIIIIIKVLLSLDLIFDQTIVSRSDSSLQVLMRCHFLSKRFSFLLPIVFKKLFLCF